MVYTTSGRSFGDTLGWKGERAVATSLESRGQRKVDFLFSSVLLSHWLVGRCGGSFVDVVTPYSVWFGDVECCSES